MITKRRGVLGFLVRAYRKFTIHAFGNTVSLRVNLLYGLYVWLLRLVNFSGLVQKVRISEEGGMEAATIHEIGFTKLLSVLPEADVRSISAKVNGLFAQPEKTVKTLEDGGLLRLKSCLLEAPELESFILAPKVKEVLQGYFGSAYTVYSCDVYRTVPSEHENPEVKFQSLKWHFDNCPSALFKVMVYLTDTNAKNGALTVVDKVTSVRLKRQGFWDRNNLKEFDEAISAGARVLEAPAGTALLFSTHYCIHKATLPKEGHRDVAVFLLYPTLNTPTALTVDDRRNASFRYGYCVNPFLGTPQRYGDE